jgi:hypothetical protein
MRRSISLNTGRFSTVCAKVLGSTYSPTFDPAERPIFWPQRSREIRAWAMEQGIA